MTDRRLRSLLLHRLPAAETTRLEDAIVLEDGFAERLCDEERDLLDDYAASSLSDDDARDVERYVLTSEHSRELLRVARALQKVASKRRRKPSQLWGFAALLAASLGIVAYIPQWHLKSSRRDDGQSNVPTISLMVDVQRGQMRPLLSIPSSGAARLQVEVPDPATHIRYSLAIDDGSGRRLWSVSALDVHTAGVYGFVETVMPVGVLGPGDRTLTLTGTGNAASADTIFTWRITGVIR